MIDFLLLELPRNDRDLNLMIPLYLYLKKRGYKVVIENINFGVLNVLKYRPRLLIFSNPHDSTVYELKRDLFNCGATIVTLTTEGNYQEVGFHGYFWGWNVEHRLHQHALLLWNNKSRKLITKFHPEFADKLFVSGSVGHDRYKSVDFFNKGAFLQQNNLQRFQKVIGIAGFGLFKYVNDPSSYAIVDPEYPKTNLQLFEVDRVKLRESYGKLIRQFPDILFILRLHPETASAFDQTEFYGLEELPNIYISSIHASLPKIDDVINISDVWIAYETNTSIEAWLLNKPVIYFNPTTADFQRENHFNGCVLTSSLEQVVVWINEFYETGKISDYECKAEVRESILKEVIEYKDGKNYERAGRIIEELYQKLPKTKAKNYWKFLRKINFKELLRQYLHNKGWYWKIRKDLQKPELHFPKDKYFGGKYIEIYNDIVA